MMIGHNLWLCTISANIYLGKTTFRSSGSKWYLFLPEIFAQRPICLYFQLWSVTSPRQMQTAAPVLVDAWQIADKYPLCLASFRLHLQIQKAFRKKKSNKPMRSLSQPRLNYSTEFVSLAGSVPSTEVAGFTHRLSMMTQTVAPGNIFEKAIHNIIFSLLANRRLHLWFFSIVLKTIMDN